MTQEEKARAYDEALNKAKIEINTKGIGETVNLCKQLFPQLAESDDEESEDERIRKRLIEYFEGFRMGNAEVRWEGLIVQEVLAWLKKQKELENTSASTMISSCLNTASLEEEVERYFYYEFEDGMTNEDIAYHFATWQRQKDLEENLKSADSIPSNCVSDAKCGDRWHNVRDSLPDNPREVLCKDEAGNYFIGRYYVGEGWEISNYDDEDKPHHLNPPVSKWIDFPSEKQKEQNGEDEFLEDELSAFLQNYDKEYDDDAAVSDVARHFYEIGKKQNEQKPHTDEEKEYIRTIKSIISDFIRDKKPENLTYYQRIYDWLDGRHVPFSCGHENGKAAEWAELRTEFNINEAFEDGKKEVIDHPDKYGLTKQKPMDFPTTDEEVKEFLETHPKVEVPEKYKTPDFVFSKQEADKSYQIGFRDGVASVKPAEWSEEDEDMLNSCISSIEEAKENRYAYKETDGDTSYDHEIAWLKSLRPQPKLEWSEEDKKILNHLIDKVQENWHIRMPNGHYFGISNDEKETFSSWLRHLPERFNLSLKQEWSEEDEKMIESICRSINEESIAEGLKCHGKSYSINELSKLQIKMTNFLKSINQKLNSFSWKPSDEQMEALKSTIVDVAKFSKRGGRQVELENEPYYSALHSLYCNLEKLM